MCLGGEAIVISVLSMLIPNPEANDFTLRRM